MWALQGLKKQRFFQKKLPGEHTRTRGSNPERFKRIWERDRLGRPGWRLASQSPPDTIVTD